MAKTEGTLSVIAAVGKVRTDAFAGRPAELVNAL